MPGPTLCEGTHLELSRDEPRINPAKRHSRHLEYGDTSRNGTLRTLSGLGRSGTENRVKEGLSIIAGRIYEGPKFASGE